MRFIISWDIGNGPEFDEVTADDMFEANWRAEERMRAEATANCCYNAQTWTAELAEEYGLYEEL